jgi:hypothetical protein
MFWGRVIYRAVCVRACGFDGDGMADGLGFCSEGEERVIARLDPGPVTGSAAEVTRRDASAVRPLWPSLCGESILSPPSPACWLLPGSSRLWPFGVPLCVGLAGAGLAS